MELAWLTSLLDGPLSLGAVFIGVVTGFLVRIRILQIDYRQYPSYPYGCIIHLCLGGIAAALGAVAVPALLSLNYVAVTFLSLAAQQFRDVRKMERETLTHLDRNELVPRGTNYVEGMAMVFEGRNYIVMGASALTSLVVMSSGRFFWGILLGIALILGSKLLLRGVTIRDVADVREAELTFQGTDAYIDGSYLANFGSPYAQKIMRKYGVAFVIQPRNTKCEMVLGSPGQRQALLHDASSTLGVYRDMNKPSLRPIAKRDLAKGRLLLLLLPLEHDKNASPYTIKEIVERVPVLESVLRASPLSFARSRPLQEKK